MAAKQNAPNSPRKSNTVMGSGWPIRSCIRFQLAAAISIIRTMRAERPPISAAPPTVSVRTDGSRGSSVVMRDRSMGLGKAWMIMTWALRCGALGPRVG